MSNKKRFTVTRTEKMISWQTVEVDLDDNAEFLEKFGLEEVVCNQLQDNYWNYDNYNEAEYSIEEAPDDRPRS